MTKADQARHKHDRGRTAAHRLYLSAALAAALAVAAAGCGGSSSSGGGTSNEAATTSSGPLSGICPNPLVIQTSWYPEFEKAVDYELVGPKGQFNLSSGYYYGNVGGVTVQVRAGGPFLGNLSNIGALYLHPDIMLTEANTDDQWADEAAHPTVAVFAPLQKSPQSILWDPQIYHFTSLQQVGQSNATILKAGEDTSSDLMITKGILKSSQFNFSYNGSPGVFISAGGKDLLYDYAGEDLYNYVHSFTQWGKPLHYLLLASAGYTSYENALVATPQTVRTRSACLKKLVPMLQRAEVNLIKDPDPIVNAMIRYADALKSQTPLSTGLAHENLSFMESNGILGNGSDGAVGSFNLARVQSFIDSLGPVAKIQNIQTKAGLKASAIVTNQFIDPSIHAPAG